MSIKIGIAIGVLAALIFTIGMVRGAEPATVALDRADMYHLQAIMAKQQAVSQQLNNLYIQFVNANPDAKAMRSQLDGLQGEASALVDLLYKNAKLSKDLYQIDVEKGEFKKIEKK